MVLAENNLYVRGNITVGKAVFLFVFSCFAYKWQIYLLGQIQTSQAGGSANQWYFSYTVTECSLFKTSFTCEESYFGFKCFFHFPQTSCSLNYDWKLMLQDHHHHQGCIGGPFWRYSNYDRKLDSSDLFLFVPSLSIAQIPWGQLMLYTFRLHGLLYCLLTEFSSWLFDVNLSQDRTSVTNKLTLNYFIWLRTLTESYFMATGYMYSIAVKPNA